MAVNFSGSLVITGSLITTGTITMSGSIASASYAANAGTASYVVNSLTASYVVNSLTASYVVNSLTASFVANAVSSSYSLNALTSSNAMTASSADTLYVRNNVTALGSITAQTLVVQTITSSVDFVTGSTRFGSLLTNTHLFTGSLSITGSLSVITTGTEFQVNASGTNIGNALTDNHIISGSVTINPNGLFVSSSGNVGVGNTSPTVALDVTGAGKFSGILTLGSTISNGTYTYTLPSATGTLALTSALSGYLPLTGGTLTGALGGTNATFSGQVNASSKYTWGSSTTGTTGQIATDGTNNYFDYIGSLIFRGAAASNTLVTFTSAGAATFSSSVTSTLAYSNTSDLSFVASANIPGYNLRSSAGGRLSIVTGYIGADISSILVGTGTNNPSTEALRIVHSTGAATFSSSVTATSFSINSNGTISQNGFWGTLHTKGTGSFADWALINSGGNGVMWNPTGTLNMNFSGSVTAGNAILNESSYLLKLGNANSANNISINISNNGGQNIDVLYAASGKTSFHNGVNVSANAFYIGRDNTYDLIVNSAGNVGIGTSSPATLLHVNGLLTVGTGGNLRLSSNSNEGELVSAFGKGIKFYTNDGNSNPINLTSGGNILMGTTTDNGERLYVSGAIRATGSITANSDITLKKNLLKIENALEKVEQINGYTYELKEDDSKRHAGVIAQEIQTVLPEIVNKGNDGILGVEYGNISALLIEAIKELSAKNTLLEERLTALENN